MSKSFEPYYDRVLQATVTSQRQKEKLMKAHRSKSHPEGIYDIRDDKKFLKEMDYIQKHREEFRASTQQGYRPKTERELDYIKRHGGERVFNRERPDYDPRYHRS